MSASVLFDAPGPKARARYRILTIVSVVLMAVLAWWVLAKLGARGELAGEKWTPFLSWDSLRFYLLQGLFSTLRAAAISIVLALAFGFLFGMGRLSENAAVRWVSGIVVEFFRAVPVLIMMIFFFGIYAYNGVFQPEYNPLAAVVTALTLYNGAVIAELVRSGVHGLAKGQREAGLSIGLTPSQTLRMIQLPQAVTAMLPALVGQLVVVLKDTALGAIITYPELINQAKTLASANSNLFQSYVVIAVLFIAINWSLTSLAARLERRINRRGHTAGGAVARPAVLGAPGAVAPVDAEADPTTPRV